MGGNGAKSKKSGGGGAPKNQMTLKPGKNHYKEIKPLFDSGKVESFTATDAKGNKFTYTNKVERRTDYLDRTEGGPKHITYTADEWSTPGKNPDSIIPDSSVARTISGNLGGVPGYTGSNSWKKVVIKMTGKRR